MSSSSGFQYVGAFYNNKLQAIKNGEVIWINQNGTTVSVAKDDYLAYSGNSKVVKLNNGEYQIMKNDVIVLGGEELEKMEDFLRKFKSN